MDEQLYLERFVRFDHEARREHFPNAVRQGTHFKIPPKTAHRFIDHFRDRLQTPLKYDKSHKGYFYTDPIFPLPVLRIELASWKPDTAASCDHVGNAKGWAESKNV